MSWHPPLQMDFVVSAESESFREMKAGQTALPLPPHPGAFGVTRKHHIHEGVDLYCPDGTPVQAVEAGTVVAVMPFTGPAAGSAWWHDTQAVLVEGDSGVVVYGEVAAAVAPGCKVAAGELIGHVRQVLKEDKGRPMSMLHLELHDKGARDAPEWTAEKGKPATLQDPTPYLRKLCK